MANTTSLSLTRLVSTLSAIARPLAELDPTIQYVKVAAPPAWYSYCCGAAPDPSKLDLSNLPRWEALPSSQQLAASSSTLFSSLPTAATHTAAHSSNTTLGYGAGSPNAEVYALATASELLFALRVAQVGILLFIPVVALVHQPARAMLAHMVNPRRRRNDPVNSDSRTDDTAAADPLDAAPQPVAIRVPVREPRRQLMHFIILAISATYVLSGILIILRAVLPPSGSRVWQPDLPLWYGLDLSDLGAFLGWSLLGIVCLLEERNQGRNKYGRRKGLWAVWLSGGTDVALLIIYLSVGAEQKRILAPWTAAQLAIVVFRIILLYPVLIYSLVSDKVRFVLASEAAVAQRNSASPSDQGENPNNASSSRSLSSSVHEGTGLLRPPSVDGADASRNPNYGATSSSAASTRSLTVNTETGNGNGATARNGHETPSGYRTPAKRPSSTTLSQAANSTAAPAAQAANASMGLSVTTAPPPPTLRVFVHRLRVLFPYLWPWDQPKLQGLAGICFVLLIIERFVNLAVPLQLGKIIDSLNGDGARAPTDPLGPIVVYAALKLVQGSGGILSALQSVLWLPVEQYSERMMSLMAFEHLLNLSMRFHTKRRTGEILRILDRGASINSFFDMLIFRFLPIFLDLTIAVVWLTRTFTIGLGGSLLLIMFVYTYFSVKLTTWRTELRREANNKDSVSRAIHTDVLMNWETVKFYSNEFFEAERYRLSLLDYQKAAGKVLYSLSMLNFIQNMCLSLGTFGMTLMVAHRVVRGQARPADFVVFLSYLQQVFGPLSMLGTLYRVIQQNLVDTDKLMSLLEEETEIKDEPDAKDLVVTNGVIEFRDVHFSYDGKNSAIQGLSFTLDPKSTAALVGESGAGKSSVLRLMYRFYDIQRGQILIDGQDIRKVTQRSLRKAIGIVPQEPSLFNTSIRHNIHYGNTEEATDDAIQAAAEAAQIWDRIQTFPKGMQEVVGERGVRLSGGEKQRVAIARTILKNPPILLLDEATSALDTHTERQLQGALSEVMRGRTSLTIAHRLSTIVNADKIIVMEAGRVIEQGTHTELLGRKGKYHSLWMQQIQTQREQEAAAEAAAQVKVSEEAVVADAVSASPTQMDIPTVQIIAGTPIPDKAAFLSLQDDSESASKGKNPAVRSPSSSVVPNLDLLKTNGQPKSSGNHEPRFGLGLLPNPSQRQTEAIEEAHVTNSDTPLPSPAPSPTSSVILDTEALLAQRATANGTSTPPTGSDKPFPARKNSSASAPGTPALDASASPRTVRQRIASFASRVGRKSISSMTSPLISATTPTSETAPTLQPNTPFTPSLPPAESSDGDTDVDAGVGPTNGFEAGSALTPAKLFPSASREQAGLQNGTNGQPHSDTETSQTVVADDEPPAEEPRIGDNVEASPSPQGKWSNKNKKRRQKKKNGGAQA